MPITSIQLAPGSLLGRLAPADTTAATIFTATVRTEITSILICNVTGSAATFRLFHGVATSTYVVGNALYYDVSVPANTTTNLDAEVHAGINLAATDTLGVRTGTADAITFSVYGVTQNIP